MDLCIKTGTLSGAEAQLSRFNPCFNGSMYKNPNIGNRYPMAISFNPCFNGSMYKNKKWQIFSQFLKLSFNPCFNGSMYKNRK